MLAMLARGTTSFCTPTRGANRDVPDAHAGWGLAKERAGLRGHACGARARPSRWVAKQHGAMLCLSCHARRRQRPPGSRQSRTSSSIKQPCHALTLLMRALMNPPAFSASSRVCRAGQRFWSLRLGKAGEGFLTLGRWKASKVDWTGLLTEREPSAWWRACQAVLAHLCYKHSRRVRSSLPTK